jgi:hypothetical protein
MPLKTAAAIGCAFDLEIYGGAVAAPLTVARKRLESGAQAPGNWRASA